VSRLVLCAVLVPALALVLWRLFRPSEAQRKSCRFGLPALAVAAFCAACVGPLADAARTPFGRMDVWGVLHYYLGAKYYDELDYFGLYARLLEADREAERIWEPRTPVRDLTDYRIVAAAKVRAPGRERFSDARWAAFVKDVATFQRLLPDYEKKNVLSDKGFNPPPSWAVPAGFLANRVDAEGSFAFKLLCNLDLLLCLLTFVLIGRAVGVASASLAAIFAFLYFGSLGRITGSFLQYAWLPALVAAFAGVRAGRPVAAGIWWAVATLLQAFPLALLAVFGLRTARGALTRGGAGAGPRRFLVAFAATLALGVLLGACSSHGWDAWAQWQRKISFHRGYLVGEMFEIGLGNLVATASHADPSRNYFFAVDYANVVARLKAFEGTRWLWYSAAVAAAAVGWRRRARLDDLGAVALGFVATYAAMSLSPYYYLALVALFVVYPWSEGRAGPAFAAALLALNATLVLLQPKGYVTFDWPMHVLTESLIAAFMLFLLVFATRRAPARPV
jgi:hypothetical protein